jgi:hypothetical protein
MLRSKLELGFKNLTTTVRSSIEVMAKEETGTPWTVATTIATAKLEDQEAPTIPMDFERLRSSKRGNG